MAHERIDEFAKIAARDSDRPVVFKLLQAIAGPDPADRRRVKVLHAARQDLEVMSVAMRDTVLGGPIFDTQIAAALLGYPAQIGYGALVAARLGQTLDKGHTRTDWSRRPLSMEQLQFLSVLRLLVIEGGSARGDGSRIMQYTCHGASNQLWQMAMLRDRDFDLLYQADTGRYAWKAQADSTHPVPVAANGANTICRSRDSQQVGAVINGVCDLPAGVSTTSFEVLVQAP